MINLKVCRNSSFFGECREEDAALNWGDVISDALLVTEEAAIARGTQEVDTEFSNRTDFTVKTYKTTFIQPGTLIGIVDNNNQANGQLQGITINISRSPDSFTAESNLSVEGNV